MRRDTLLDFFQDFAELPNEFLIYDDGFHSRVYHYNEAAAKARGFAARLREAGIGSDDKIILYGENRPEWIIAWWGCLLEGVIVVPIDYRSSSEFIDRIDRIVNAKAIVIGDNSLASMTICRARLPRHRSRAIRSPRSSLLPAQRPSRRASSSRTAISSPT